MRQKLVLVEVSQIESTFPLASAYLQNYAQTHALSARDWDFQIQPFHASASADVITAQITTEPGAVYAFSCYNWNMKRIRQVLERLRVAAPKASILLGGPQVLTCIERYVSPEQENVFVCNGEGERTLQVFLDEHADVRPDYQRVPGISFFRDGQLCTTKAPAQVELDSIPSPFLSSPFGASTFFVNYLWESNRGCPFHCTFCLWGQLQDTLSKFDTDRLKEEITWLAKRQYMSLDICDANWGILPRDLELSEHIARCKRDYGSPFIISAAHFKNAPDRVVQMTQMFAEVGIFANAANALQSVNESTLVTIKRKNASEERVVQFQRSLGERGFGSIIEVIWPLPEETLTSLIRGLSSMVQMRVGSVFCYPLMLLNNTEMSARREEHGFTTVWDPSEVKEIEWVVSTKDVTEVECQRGFWFYLAFMLLYNSRTLYYTLHYLAEVEGVPYEHVLQAFADELTNGEHPLAKLCRSIVVDRAPSLDGATFGTLFGWALHAHRAEFDVLLLEFCARQPWWDRPSVRAVVELDLVARPFLFANPALFQAPATKLEHSQLTVGNRRFELALPEALYSWLQKNVEVGMLNERYTGTVVLDHARGQLPHVRRKTDEDAGYLLTSLMVNIRSLCPKMSAPP